MDATILQAPSSTKNTTGTRDPEMQQTRKGKQWYFGMKAHVGVDSATKLIHAVVATRANVADWQGGEAEVSNGRTLFSDLVFAFLHKT